jgi:peptide/nickel transport system permease protein
MLRFLAHRLLATLPVLLTVAILVFLILQLTPGDPAAVIAGDSATGEDVRKIRESLGLNQPMLTQFMIWVGRTVQGDLGFSFYMNKPVSELIALRIGPTFSLAAGTLLLSILVALPLGTIAAWRMGGWIDRVLSALSVGGFTTPVFVTAYLLIYLFAVRLELLPVQGYRQLDSFGAAAIWTWAQHLLLPWLTLSTVYIALIARITRTSVSEALTEDYIRTARAKGLPASAVLIRHALANAAVPIVTVIGIGVAMLIGGVVVTETVFSIPGLGSLMVDAVFNRDFPVTQGLVLFFSLVYVLINLLVDMSYLFLDPRIRY